MKKKTMIWIGVAIGIVAVPVIVMVIVVVIDVAMMFMYVDLDHPEIKKASGEGAEIGKTTDKQGCMNQGLERSKQFSFELKNIRHGIALERFVDRCLEASKPTPNFCDGVPSILSSGESEWKVSECQKLGMTDETMCQSVFASKYAYCRLR